jgi:hypothetical protein
VIKSWGAVYAILLLAYSSKSNTFVARTIAQFKIRLLGRINKQ